MRSPRSMRDALPESTRRGFMMGCSAAIASLAGARFTSLVFADPGPEPWRDTLVVLFLRGGVDGLNVVMPTGGPDRAHYETARPVLRVPASGTNAALPLGSLGGNSFGLHPGAAPLHELFLDRRVAFIHACGIAVPSRSHFDNQAEMEMGISGGTSPGSGWLTRHFQSAPNQPPGLVLPKLAVSSTIQTSWEADLETVAMTNPDDFELNTGPSAWRDEQKIALRRLLDNPVYAGDFLRSTGLAALDATTLVENLPVLNGTYVPSNGAVYPSGSYGDALKLVARLVKGEVGLKAATLDLGGWDTHNGQGGVGSGTYFHDKLAELGSGLLALYTDLDGAPPENHTARLTVVVMSEFGRRLRENADGGTDHGHGNLVIAMGKGIKGGLYGDWPGLATGQLYDQADLAITTDYRQVLSEILVQRLANPNVGQVFPGYAYPGHAGFATLFQDGFASGDLRAWPDG